MQTLFQDLRYTLRQLRTQWGFALMAVLALALGVGANTALFTVVESVLLRPLPYAHANRLMYVGNRTDKPAFSETSWLNYRDVRDTSHSFAAVGGYSVDLGVVETKGASLSVVAPRMTPNVFTMLGVQPLVGRTFTEAEGRFGGPQVALLSEELWRTAFSADPHIVGKVVRVSGVPRTVVGVMPATFCFPDETGADIRKGLWLPMQPTTQMSSMRGYNFFSILGQLRPGLTAAAAQADMEAVAHAIAHDDPKDGKDVHLEATPYQDLLTGAVRPVLYGLLAALGLVLVIACANVANLLIARSLGRRQEFAVRAALGASRRRLIQQVLTEGAVLSIAGCGLGMALAVEAVGAVRKLPDGTIPRGSTIALHWPVVLALAGVATLTTVLSSLLPALLMADADPQPALQAASRGVGARSAGGQWGRLLVAAEVALSTILLVGTGLLFHTLWNLEHKPLGFAAERLTMFSAMPADAAGFGTFAVTDSAQAAPTSIATTVYAPVLARMRAVPGVQSAAMATSPPLSGMDMHSSFTIAGQPDHLPKAQTRETRLTAVSADYARTMGTPLLRGRMVGEQDGPSAPYVVVVNQALVSKYFAGKDPLLQQVSLGGKDTGMLRPYTIVGVLADQVDDSVAGAPQSLMLLPYQQVPTTSLFYPALLNTVVSFVVRTRGAVALAPEMRSVFQQTAPGYAVDSFETMQEAVDQNTFSQRLGLYLIGSFAALAVAMVLAGVYGVLAQLVSYRRREISIRMALGATRQSVARLVLREASLLMSAGLVAGVVLALLGGRLIKSFLYSVQPSDPWTYAGVVLTIAVIGTLASLLPSLRAARIEPVEALRQG